MPDKVSPEIMFFAGPNGSGKSTITRAIPAVGQYINADEIKKVMHYDDLTSAQKAEQMRNHCLKCNADFTFETVLSTERNLKLLVAAKEKGYFIRGIYVITSDPYINVARISGRVMDGGHDVPTEKVISRYWRSLALIPQVLAVCDICNIYDNSGSEPIRIFKKHKDKFFFCETETWSKSQICTLTGVSDNDLYPLTQLHK